MAWAAAERCCGFGGLFSFKLPEMSVAMADDKLASLAPPSRRPTSSWARTARACMHLRGRAVHEGRPIETRHIAQVLASGLEGKAP